MSSRNLILKRTGVKDVHLKHKHVSKEQCTSQYCEENSGTVSGKLASFRIACTLMHRARGTNRRN